MSAIVVRVPVKLSSVNRSGFGLSKGAMYARSAEIKRVRETTRECVLAALGPVVSLPEAVHVVRISAGKLDDDNLVGSTKACLDGLAKALGVDDRRFVLVGDRPGIKITFDQRSEGRGVFAAVLELRFADAA